ncbi:methionine--tRNA ligase [Candidatus Peribacteria bacterium RIFOXYC2_FULL_58_10]|nr:MAG: methionine--tRNA ligase [Candidatus Peribacteria bacterium RIFOXYC2_FULL_58_10]OGJ84584.1 MAG: methionine--tRNA ligase [Candidatus Peribacteria bacterium RIFOXYD2_FULL_58_15]
MARQYITTAIDYPNALRPHMGQVLEKVLADVVARWFRLRGDSVRFQIGTDEHGVKIQRKAQQEGLTPQQLVDRNVPNFIALYDRLGITYDAPFIRTTDKVRHWPTVQALWKKLEDAGMLEKRTYTGLYCQGCERFMTKRDLVDGKCPDHHAAPEEVSEENWFFLLEKESGWLKKLLTQEKGGYHIVPQSRAHETLSLIEQGLEDVSFSRPKSSLQWGIPVPGDEGQTMYVWCDALTNYISGLGYFTDHEEKEWWDKPAEVTHVIGKDIARFHALIWPAMLKTAGVRTPDRLLIHGFLTCDGQKMSKSIGNIVEPEEVLAKFGGNPDPLRFYLSHEIPVGNDGDFSWKRIEEIYDAVLRNNLGNLLNRVLVMLKKEGSGLRIDAKASDAEQVMQKWESYREHMDGFALHEAVKLIMEWVRLMNAGFNSAAPWTFKDDAAYRINVLSGFSEYLRHIALMLLPFAPDTAYRISKQLNVPYAEKMLAREFVITKEMKQWGSQKDWKKVGEPEILFKPLD